MAGRYEYSPLDPNRNEIRLLIIESRSERGDEIIACTVIHSSITPKHQSLSTAPSYETMSYCWGDTRSTSAITLNGKLCHVHRSAAQALRKVRLLNGKRTIWIDVICINQEDVAERSRQVRMMAEIYRNGSRNLVCLGDEENNVAAALESVDLLMKTEIADATRNGASLIDIMFAADGTRLYNTFDRALLLHDTAITALFSRPWFSRIWVVQEVAMAQRSTVYCGSHEFDLQVVLMVARWLKQKTEHISKDLQDSAGLSNAARMFNFTKSMHALYGSGRWQPNLSNTLRMARDFECADPRDKLFAIQGLMDWDDYGGLPWSYRPTTL